MRTPNPNLSCASAFVRQSRTFHSLNALCTSYRMHTFLNWRNILSWIPFGSDLIQTVFANWERERLVQARQSKHCIGGSTSRERERWRCVCVLFEFRQFFFYSRNSSMYFSFVSIFAQKKSDRTRCLVVSILEYNLEPKITGPRYNISWNSKSAERARNSVVIHR